MKFSTEVPIKNLANPITYDSKIVTVGSCFAVNMAEKFKTFQFQHVVNPFGILFHPVALANLFEFAEKDYIFEPKDIFCHQEVWSCFDAHSDLNELDEEEILFNLNAKIRDFKSYVSQATHVNITLGTAWVYRFLETDALVANCHKIPQKQFVKEILSVETIVKSLQKIETVCKTLNPTIQLLFTISPVRHIKDGVVENQQSKAHLITALHQFLKNTEHYYFPSYEIVMDELRDYRFYTSDLLHPNQIAIDFIWEKFKTHCIAENAYKTMQLVDEVQKGLAHRPFNPYSEQHGKFLDNLGEKLDTLLNDFPFMNFR